MKYEKTALMKKMLTRLFVLLSIFCLDSALNSSDQLYGQTENQGPFQEKHFDALKWRLVGPFRGGRAGTIAGVKEYPNLFYIGTAGGGVWKTEDGGNSWSCISDGYFGGSIGAVTVAESDPNVIYVGEGGTNFAG